MTRTSTGLILVAVLAAACGGGTSSATTPPATQSGGQDGTVPPAPTSVATAVSGATQPPQGGGAGGAGAMAAKACDLLTTAEIDGVIGGGGWTSELLPRDEVASQCMYSSATSGVFLSISTAAGSEAVFDLLASGKDDAATVDGVGEKAIFSTSTETLVFVKSGALISLVAGVTSDGYDKRLAYSKALGALIANRL
jgi:hypothetical protein